MSPTLGRFDPNWHAPRPGDNYRLQIVHTDEGLGMRLVRSGLRLFVGLSFLALPTATSLIRPAAAADKSPDPKRPYGLEKRVLWTTSRVQGSPDPASPFHTESAFPKLKFDEPIAMAHAPGSDRVYLLQRFGKLLSFPNNPTVGKNELVLDVKKEVLGLTLHPGFERNGYVFIASLTVAADAQPRTVRVSRFKVDQGESPRSDAKSELVLIEWPSLYHDGCCLVFGRDGYLYVSAGDGGGSDNGQGLGDLSSSIMRIDVDHAEGNRPYAIPPDNPFIGLAGARPEVWAYGLRNPWRFSIDRVTGDLWAGDVGQDLWELVYLVRRGGNYGWNVREGNHPYQPYRKQGPTPILPPIVEHTHAEARSITGGYVYRGSRLKDLIGAYVYGDYDTGKIWALRYDGQKVLWHKEIAETNHRIVAFDEDNAGELYLVDHMGGSVHQLVPSPPSADPQNFPRKLSETGLFESIRDLRPAPGLIPYTVNAPLWSDGATKERYLALPGDSKIEYDAMLFPGDETTPGKGWKFPAGTVLVKTFFLDLEKGNPARRIRLETRLLHHKRLVGREEFGDQFWRGYTYIWNDEQTDATLLENPDGLDRTFTIRDTDAPGGSRQQTWHFPSRTECMVCHTVPAKFVLGVNTMQMNRDFDYGGVVDNQIRSWEHIGLFTKPLPKPPEELPRLADYRDKSKDLESRARAYLHVNCSNCHRGFGGGNANFQLLATDPLAQMGIMDTPPTQGTFGIPDARVVAPGAPVRSIIVHRMSTREAGKMPPLASSVIDQEGLQLIRDWIRGLPVDQARTDHYPKTVLKNEDLALTVYLPDAEKGFYRGNRFDWAGVVGNIEFRGHRLFGPWKDTHDPTHHDDIIGPVEDFGPIGYSEAKDGEPFFKIGIGEAIKGGGVRFGDLGTRDVTIKPNEVVFKHSIRSGTGYGCQYTKRLEVEPGHGGFRLHHVLTNTGAKVIDTDCYNHNFYNVDADGVGPNYVVTCAGPLKPKETRGRFDEVMKIRDGRILEFTKPLNAGDDVYGTLDGLGGLTGNFIVRHGPSGVITEITGDAPLEKVNFWATRETVCPEPFVRIRLKPGESKAWSIRYAFRLSD